MQIDHNTELKLENQNAFDNERLDDIFENPEEEVILDYNEVDEYELED